LEYAYDDFCIAKMATDLGKMDVYQKYYKSALNFINVHDPKTGFMRARRNGLWYSPFDPSEVNFNYTEANSWQYSLYAPHAIDVLSEMMGGKDSLGRQHLEFHGKVCVG
jgi:putative alpha-1,2-mannosidase